MNLEVLDFINTHSNWQELLTQKPYAIKINHDGEFTVLSYSQTESDFSLRIVQECRGLILAKEADKYVPVCVPFFKFFNYGEPHAAKIDWASAKVQEKIDGALIKTWTYKGNLHISTNNMIDAFKARIALPTDKFKTYGDIALYCLEKQFLGTAFFESPLCFMYELVSPYTRVVIPYKETKLYLLGARDRETLQEYDFHDIAPDADLVQQYNISTLQDCIDNAAKLPIDKEGYVVVDKDFNRIKVKSPLYVAAHHVRTNVATTRSIIEILRKGEETEFLTYFPEYTEVVKQWSNKYFKYCSALQSCKDYIDTTIKQLPTRKEQAIELQLHCKNCMDFAFRYIDGKVNTIGDFVKEMSLEVLEKKLQLF